MAQLSHRATRMVAHATRFAGKVCLVTGGGSGIGRATCQRFAAEGAFVCVVDLNEAHANDTVGTITQAGGAAVAARADVSQSADVRAAISVALQRTHRLDVIVNDAAMMTFQSILDLAEADWDRVLAVNLRSAFLFCKYGVPHMPPGSVVVNLSSVHAHETTANVVPYATSKGGIEAFTRGLSIELAKRHVRINSVAPSAVDTPMLWSNPNLKSGAEKIEGSVAKPEDLAAVIAFVASSDARFVNGTTIVADGGRLDIL